MDQISKDLCNCIYFTITIQVYLFIVIANKISIEGLQF